MSNFSFSFLTLMLDYTNFMLVWKIYENSFLEFKQQKILNWLMLFMNCHYMAVFFYSCFVFNRPHHEIWLWKTLSVWVTCLKCKQYKWCRQKNIHNKAIQAKNKFIYQQVHQKKTLQRQYECFEYSFVDYSCVTNMNIRVNAYFCLGSKGKNVRISYLDLCVII